MDLLATHLQHCKTCDGLTRHCKVGVALVHAVAQAEAVNGDSAKLRELWDDRKAGRAHLLCCACGEQAPVRRAVFMWPMCFECLPAPEPLKEAS